MSESMRDHLQRTGISPSMLKQLAQSNVLIEQRIAGANAAAPYVPFGQHFAGWSPTHKRQEAADFVIDNIDQARNLRGKSRVSGINHSAHVHPILIHELELRKIGAAYNPTPYMRSPLEKDALRPAKGAPLKMYQDFLRY
jgi:hypothetical protein